MTEEQKEAKSSPGEVSKEEYLQRIPELERKNLEKITQDLGDVMTEKQLEGAFFAVGGSITKPWPRKDIDTVLVFEESEKVPKYEAYPTRYQFSLADFEIVRGLVEGLIARNPQLQITELIEPAIDEEFGSESILKHEGSITLRPPADAPIEIVRSPERGARNFTTKAKEPYVVLAYYTKKQDG